MNKTKGYWCWCHGRWYSSYVKRAKKPSNEPPNNSPTRCNVYRHHLSWTPSFIIQFSGSELVQDLIWIDTKRISSTNPSGASRIVYIDTVGMLIDDLMSCWMIWLESSDALDLNPGIQWQRCHLVCWTCRCRCWEICNKHQRYDIENLIIVVWTKALLTAPGKEWNYTTRNRKGNTAQTYICHRPRSLSWNPADQPTYGYRNGITESQLERSKYPEQICLDPCKEHVLTWLLSSRLKNS